MKSAFIKNTHMPMNDGAVPVDHVGLRRAIDTQIQSYGALSIDNIQLLRITQLRQPGAGFRLVIFIVKPVNGHTGSR